VFNKLLDILIVQRPGVLVFFLLLFLVTSRIVNHDYKAIPKKFFKEKSYYLPTPDQSTPPSMSALPTANCVRIISVIQSQSPISISLVSFPQNAAKQTQRSRLSIEMIERRNDTPNAIGCISNTSSSFQDFTPSTALDNSH